MLEHPLSKKSPVLIKISLFFCFFFLIENEISEQASRQIAREEPNRGLSTCQGP